MNIRDFVNYYYETKIKDKDPNYITRHNYICLSMFYVATRKFSLEWELTKDSESITLVNDSYTLKITLTIADSSVLVFRWNKTELIEDIEEFIEMIYWLSHEY